MVASEQFLPSQTPEQLSAAEERGAGLAKLKVLHAEAEETAHLANLLGRSLYVGTALPIMAILTITLSVDMNPAAQLVWVGFVAAVTAAMLIAYRHAMREPFEREGLKSFAKDLRAILLFAGFAWGSGAFLAVADTAEPLGVVAFAAIPSVLIAYLLRTREALFLFLAPVTGLTTAACLLKPFVDSYLLASLVLVSCAVIAGATALYERLTGLKSKPAMLSLP